MSNQVEIVTPEAVQVSIELQEGPTPELILNAPTIPVVVELNAPLLQQPTAAIRVDASTAGTVYVGRASYGTPESSESWSITRTTYSAAGVRTSRTTATAVTWTGRVSYTYN
jgi:hypothetical protein